MKFEKALSISSLLNTGVAVAVGAADAGATGAGAADADAGGARAYLGDSQPQQGCFRASLEKPWLSVKK